MESKHIVFLITTVIQFFNWKQQNNKRTKFSTITSNGEKKSIIWSKGRNLWCSTVFLIHVEGIDIYEKGSQANFIVIKKKAKNNLIFWSHANYTLRDSRLFGPNFKNNYNRWRVEEFLIKLPLTAKLTSEDKSFLGTTFTFSISALALALLPFNWYQWQMNALARTKKYIAQYPSRCF